MLFKRLSLILTMIMVFNSTVYATSSVDSTDTSNDTEVLETEVTEEDEETDEIELTEEDEEIDELNETEEIAEDDDSNSSTEEKFVSDYVKPILDDNSDLLYESNELSFYYRDDRDLFTIINKDGKVFKTGIDTPLGTEDVPDDEPIVEKGLNSTFTGIANSILYLEYYDGDTIKRTSSAGQKDVTSELKMVSDNQAEFIANFKNLEIQIIVDITFLDYSIKFDIPFENISGEGVLNLAAIILNPFLGASGGMEEHYNPEIEDYEEAIERPLNEGYIFVPDGSGSLIEFKNNDIAFSDYTGTVYGADPATQTYANSSTSQVVEMQDPTLPVFGVAHTDEQKAFVAYADKGAEYMTIISKPKENMNIKYYWVYPRFEYNNNYFQVYNQKGSGYFKNYDNLNEFDISITYSFLYDEDADYVGMARRYREHLIETGDLTPLEDDKKVNGDIPIRLDFIMNDSKSSVIGTTQVNVTDADEVEEILDNLMENGVTNINSGLIGWQAKGETLAQPNDYKFSNVSGSKSRIETLINDFNAKGVDISLSNDYSTINKNSSSYLSSAVQHMNSLYPTVDKSKSLPDNVPVSEFSYAHPRIASTWLIDIVNKINSYSQSVTIDGISNVLSSSYKNETFSLLDAVELYQETFEKIDTDVNLVAPNKYLLKYTDRYLQSAVTDSKYIFETDTVPFLQLVLNNTMEVYAPYANFSFYTQDDILTMIDYNVYPSFMLSKKSSHLLQDTHSSNLYSTESELYEPLIYNIYGQVNDVLSNVAMFDWIDREEVSNGVIVNTYSSGDIVVINYNDVDYKYNGTTIEALTAKFITN